MRYTGYGERQMKKNLIIILIALCILCIVILASIIYAKQEATEPIPAAKAQTHTSTTGTTEGVVSNSESQTQSEPQTLSESEITTRHIEDLLSNMTLEEKIGQLFYIDLNSLNGSKGCSQISDTIIQNLKAYKPGGVILFEDNILYTSQVKELNQNLQNYSTYPLFIGVDEEGGIVQRISHNSSLFISSILPMREIGDTGDTVLAYNTGVELADRLSQLGFNMNFAPVADVLTNENNTEIGTRSFGTDPLLVSSMVKEVVRGLQDNAISATLKHFPGHGDSQANSHNGYSETLRTLDEMRLCEFLPFSAGIEEDVTFILVSHIAAPEVTGSQIPCSLSETIITGLLKNELGYKGIIITDALNMGAVTDYWNSADAAIQAIEAGADMLLMPADFKSAYDAVLTAVHNGEITEDRINESVRKILEVKYKNMGESSFGD